MQRVRAIRLGAGFVVVMAVVLAAGGWQPVAAGGATSSGYRVLKPIESGDLTLFPVVRDDGKSSPADEFLDAR